MSSKIDLDKFTVYTFPGKVFTDKGRRYFSVIDPVRSLIWNTHNLPEGVTLADSDQYIGVLVLENGSADNFAVYYKLSNASEKDVMIRMM